MPEIFPRTIPCDQDLRLDPEPLVKDGGRHAGSVYRTVLAASYLTADAMLEDPVAPTEAETARMLALIDWRSDIVVGVKYAVTLVERPDGRRSAIASVQRRVLGRRGSGKVFTRWADAMRASLTWTARGLLVRTSSQSGSDMYSSDGVTGSARVWDEAAEVIAHSFVDDLLRSIARAMDKVLHDGSTRDNRLQIETASLHRRIGEGPADATVDGVLGAVAQWIGDAPVSAQRFPLDGPQRSLVAKLAHESDPWLDAEDLRQVAANAFGKTRVTRPLVRAVGECTPAALAWFRLFRGLVPTEAIVEAMAANRPTMSLWDNAYTSHQAQAVRAILVRTPEAVLKRILKEPRSASVRSLRDMSGTLSNPKVGRRRDIDALPELIAARGQRNVRGVVDLEHLVWVLPEAFSKSVRRRNSTMQVLDREQRWSREMRDYNLLMQEQGSPEANWEQWLDDGFREAADALVEDARRARMREEERIREERAEQSRIERLAREAERAQWCADAAAQLHGSEWTAPDGTVLKAVVADSPKLLRLWGEAMGNCIGGYGHAVGLDLLVGIHDAATDKLLLNAQVTQHSGIEQLLGKSNRDAAKAVGEAVAQSALDRLMRLGATASRDAWGLGGLRLELLEEAALPA